MVKIYLVRHGEAAEGWTSQDPPLSELGKSQAKSLMTFIDSIFDENSTNNTNAISSPLNRCIETASLALEKQNLEIEINDNFRELPSPTLDLEKRVNWLRRVLPLTWSELLKDKETKDSGVNFIQWKTIKDQDGIFSKMDFDPQIVNLTGGKSILLPRKSGGERLGHNFSLYWVCKNI